MILVNWRRMRCMD